MFGPLNGVRTALVIGAFAAAIAAFFTGYALAGAVLLVGVGIHGLGWVYLYGQTPPDQISDNMTPNRRDRT